MNVIDYPGFNRDDKGPGRRTGIDVRKVSGTDKLRVVVASYDLAGYWTHWDPERRCTFPCTNDHKLCQGELKQMPRRWCAWLHVVMTSATPGYWLELTASARDNLLDVLPEGNILRGTKLLVYRTKKTDKSPLKFENLGRVEENFELALPADSDNILRRLYRRHNFPGLESGSQVD